MVLNFFCYRFEKKEKKSLKPEKKKQTLIPFSPNKSRFHEKNFNDAECSIDGNITIICPCCNYPIYKVSVTQCMHVCSTWFGSTFTISNMHAWGQKLRPTVHTLVVHITSQLHEAAGQDEGKTNYSNLTKIKQSNLPSSYVVPFFFHQWIGVLSLLCWL